MFNLYLIKRNNKSSCCIIKFINYNLMVSESKIINENETYMYVKKPFKNAKPKYK